MKGSTTMDLTTENALRDAGRPVQPDPIAFASDRHPQWGIVCNPHFPQCDIDLWSTECVERGAAVGVSAAVEFDALVVAETNIEVLFDGDRVDGADGTALHLRHGEILDRMDNGQPRFHGSDAARMLFSTEALHSAAVALVAAARLVYPTNLTTQEA